MLRLVQRALKRIISIPLSAAQVSSRERRGFVEFDGDWHQAKEVTAAGYASEAILMRVLEASLAVRDGRAIHERDAVNFDRIDYSWPVLASLLWSAAHHGGQLRVLDIGGSLGTSFRQNRRFLASLTEVSWAIVEQPMFVTAGRELFEDDVLTFHESTEEAAATRPNVALLGSSLQYFDDPFAELAVLSRTGVSILVLDRTPIHDGPSDLVTIQHVPSNIYEAAYPAWIFARSSLLGRLEGLGWEVVEEFPGPEAPMTTSGGQDFSWTGFILRRSDVPYPATTLTVA